MSPEREVAVLRQDVAALREIVKCLQARAAELGLANVDVGKKPTLTVIEGDRDA